MTAGVQLDHIDRMEHHLRRAVAHREAADVISQSDFSALPPEARAVIEQHVAMGVSILDAGDEHHSTAAAAARDLHMVDVQNGQRIQAIS